MSFEPLPRAFRDDLAACDRGSCHILDLGCGTGAAWTQELRIAQPVGMDRFPPRMGTVAAVVGDAIRAPLRSAAFDLVVASNLLRHLLPNAEGADLISGWQDLVRPGGALYLFEDEPEGAPAGVRNYRDLQAFLARVDPGHRGALVSLVTFRTWCDRWGGAENWQTGLMRNEMTADTDAVIEMLRGSGSAPEGEAARLIAAIKTDGLNYGRFWWAAWHRAPREETE